MFEIDKPKPDGFAKLLCINCQDNLATFSLVIYQNSVNLCNVCGRVLGEMLIEQVEDEE